jgi:hypothetical protein
MASRGLSQTTQHQEKWDGKEGKNKFKYNEQQCRKHHHMNHLQDKGQSF